MIEWTEGKVDQVTELFRNVSVLGAIVMVAIAYYKTRTIVALVVAALTAGVFLWSINNIGWWTDRVEDESESGAPAAPVEDSDDVMVTMADGTAALISVG